MYIISLGLVLEPEVVNRIKVFTRIPLHVYLPKSSTST